MSEQNIQQAMVSGVQSLSVNDETAPLVAQSQVSQPQFLSGVPMVNPGAYSPGIPVSSAPKALEATAIPQESQPPMSQPQSMVFNMAAYSSSE